MRSLARNQQKIYYARISDHVPILDADGNETGEYSKQYDKITELWINVSPASGSVYQNPFGQSLQYDKTLSTADTALFTENDVGVAFWIGKEPPDNLTSITHNYELRGVATGLNGSLIAVGRVNVQ